jgi:hypothetical protein
MGTIYLTRSWIIRLRVASFLLIFFFTRNNPFHLVFLFEKTYSGYNRNAPTHRRPIRIGREENGEIDKKEEIETSQTRRQGRFGPGDNAMVFVGERKQDNARIDVIDFSETMLNELRDVSVNRCRDSA